MRKFTGAITLAAMVLFLPGCGTIFNGTRQNVRLQSTPNATTVRVDPGGGATYTTPTTLNLERKNNYTLTFSKAGYESESISIDRNINGGILVLDILAGLVGVIVDAATGGWYNLSPSDATVSLSPSSGQSPPITVSLETTSEGIGIVATEPVEVSVKVAPGS